MNSKDTDNKLIVVSGATMLAFGLASERPDNVLIIEPGASPAPEFAGAFFAGNGPPTTSRSPAGADLDRELTERNILHNGRYHVPALAPVLMRRIRDQKIQCLFWTDITYAKPTSDTGIKISFFNASGLQKIKASAIIDTTSKPGIFQDTTEFKEKSLRAALHGNIAENTEIKTEPGTEWQPGRFGNESYFSVKLDPDIQWPEARQLLMKAWHNRPEPLSKTLIAAIATEFHYPCAPEKTAPAPGVTRICSAGFADPLDAFEAGVAMAKEIN